MALVQIDQGMGRPKEVAGVAHIRYLHLPTRRRINIFLLAELRARSRLTFAPGAAVDADGYVNSRGENVLGKRSRSSLCSKNHCDRDVGSCALGNTLGILTPPRPRCRGPLPESILRHIFELAGETRHLFAVACESTVNIYSAKGLVPINSISTGNNDIKSLCSPADGVLVTATHAQVLIFGIRGTRVKRLHSLSLMVSGDHGPCSSLVCCNSRKFVVVSAWGRITVVKCCNSLSGKGWAGDIFLKRITPRNYPTASLQAVTHVSTGTLVTAGFGKQYVEFWNVADDFDGNHHRIGQVSVTTEAHSFFQGDFREVPLFRDSRGMRPLHTTASCTGVALSVWSVQNSERHAVRILLYGVFRNVKKGGRTRVELLQSLSCDFPYTNVPGRLFWLQFVLGDRTTPPALVVGNHIHWATIALLYEPAPFCNEVGVKVPFAHEFFCAMRFHGEKQSSVGSVVIGTRPFAVEKCSIGGAGALVFLVKDSDNSPYHCGYLCSANCRRSTTGDTLLHSKGAIRTPSFVGTFDYAGSIAVGNSNGDVMIQQLLPGVSRVEPIKITSKLLRQDAFIDLS